MGSGFPLPDFRKSMRRLIDFEIYENEIPLADTVRIARWDNKAVCNALFYIEALGENTETEELLQKALTRNIPALKALIFGALKSKNPSYTAQQFKREFKIEQLLQCYGKAVKGVLHYLPDKQGKTQAENNEPDGIKSASFINDYAELAASALKMRREDILNASPRSISAIVKAFLGEENLKDEYYGDEIPWL